MTFIPSTRKSTKKLLGWGKIKGDAKIGGRKRSTVKRKKGK